MKKIILYISAILLLFTLNACEKVVNVKLNEGDHIPYVDAWITDQPGVQTIKFLQAVNYLDAKAPASIADAQITVTDITTGKPYVFNYNNGAYKYDAGTGRIGFRNHVYKLGISWKGQQFEAYDTIKRNTVIDSITHEHKDATGGRKEGIFATFYAVDLRGATDYYWIRTYKNDSLNYYAGEMFSIDGSFNENVSDGFEFIPPFREGITPFDRPYHKGDVVKVLIRSLSKPSHDFGSRANNQIRNGGLFATILENVPSNIKNLQGNGTRIYGWFGTVEETSKSVRIE